MTSGYRPGPRSRAKSHLATETVRRPRPKGGGAVPFATLFWRLPWLRSLLLLTPPLAWFVVIYFASLILLLITAFWTTDPFTTQIVQVWTTSNFERLINEPVYHDIVGRTVVLAALVTLTDALLAFPFAYYMARLASRRVQTLLFAAVLLPLWASYLARVYAWILILNHSGVLNWSLQSIGLPPANIGYTNVAMWVVFSYIWLPFMIIPAYSALERVPESLLEASADLGARRWRTIRDIVLPLALPGVVAGSIFTFSLTLGDFITPVLVGGAGSTFIGNVVYANIGIANNVPFAAALSTIPVAIMAVYLLIARRLGAFEAL
ncbi:MAG: ABC transporter permease [Chloroflexi bacterium]|nr:MAG: ABC transporter permease [Chloroflexota bacterium]TMG65072.1 MAG: ABC transporter permease [Chloroflexota bacterium]